MADEEVSERKDSIASQSPEHVNEKESPDQSQGDVGNAENVSRDWKVWTEDETRTLIQIYKKTTAQFPDYSQKLLFQEISQELKNIGYYKGPERIRNRMKSLRTAYRRTIDYNAKHTLKKEFPYMEELEDLYNGNASLSDDNDTSNNSSFQTVIKQEKVDDDYDDKNYSIAKQNGPTKKIRLVRASKTVKPEVANPVFYRKFSVSKLVSNSTLNKKRPPTKKTIFPWFQCGQCYGKFSTSQEMHSHICQNALKNNANGSKQDTAPKKTSSPSLPSIKTTFQWTGIATLQFLQLLKGYMTKTLQSKRGIILKDISAAMKKQGMLISTEELNRKWKCLAGNYEKTANYNMKHADKKKCAFYKRLTELYGLGAYFSMFDNEKKSVRTVQVSPFSVSAPEMPLPNSSAAGQLLNGNVLDEEIQDSQNNDRSNFHNSSKLISWLDSWWQEWKEMERKKEKINADRHHELMEVLSCLAENVGNRDIDME